MRKIVLCCILIFFLVGCRNTELKETEKKMDLAMNVSESTETIDLTECTEETVMEETELLSALNHPEKEDFVRVTDYIPDIFVELKYSTADNFTGQVIYDFEDVFLRYGTVMKLKAVSEELLEMGLYLKIWDGFRPVSAQFKLWEICPDPTYVANPNKGFSNHSRGFAVDVTLADNEGREVEMPTGFDDFSAMADRDYSDCAPSAAENAQLLESVMEKHGFSGYWGEWWHFNDTEKYDVESCFDPSAISRKYTQESTALLKECDHTSDEILVIPADTAVAILGFSGEFVLVEYWGYRGYISAEKIQ